MFILLKMVHRKCILTDVNIPHLHKSHDAPYLPPKILQKHCFQFLLEKLKTQIGEHKLPYEGSERCRLEMTAGLMLCFADLRRF